MPGPNISEILRTIGYGAAKHPAQELDNDVLANVISKALAGPNAEKVSQMQQALRVMTTKDQLAFAQKRGLDPEDMEELIKLAQTNNERAWYGPESSRGPHD